MSSVAGVKERTRWGDQGWSSSATTTPEIQPGINEATPRTQPVLNEGTPKTNQVLRKSHQPRPAAAVTWYLGTTKPEPNRCPRDPGPPKSQRWTQEKSLPCLLTLSYKSHIFQPWKGPPHDESVWSKKLFNNWLGFGGRPKPAHNPDIQSIINK